MPRSVSRSDTYDFEVLTHSPPCSCNFLTQYLASPLVTDHHIYEFGACATVSNCTGNSYQSSAPTMTTNRFCKFHYSNCTANATYSRTPATLTTDVVCSTALTACMVGTTYQTKVRSCHVSVQYCTVDRGLSQASSSTSSRLSRNTHRHELSWQRTARNASNVL